MMPYQDGSGPEGLGPMSGRSMGPCAEGSVRSRGLGRGRGFGLGGGVRSGYCPRYSTPQNELEVLKEDQKMLKEDLSVVEKRLKELKGSK